MSIEQDYSFRRGDTFTLNLAFKDSDEVAIDITDYTIYFTMKRSELDSDDDAVNSQDVTDHSDPENGISEIEIGSAESLALDAGTYYYDVKYKDGNDKVVTVQEGVITVMRTSTQRASE